MLAERFLAGFVARRFAEHQTCDENRVVHEILATGWPQRARGVVGEADDGVTSEERAATRRLITVSIGIPSVLAASA